MLPRMGAMLELRAAVPQRRFARAEGVTSYVTSILETTGRLGVFAQEVRARAPLSCQRLLRISSSRSMITRAAIRPE